MNQTLSRWLACGACAAGSVVLAQEPAATLLPVRAVDPPAPAVVRAAPPAPSGQFQAPTSVPAPGVNRPQPKQPQAAPPQQGQPNPWGEVKSIFGGKPSQPPPESSKPWWPTTEPQQQSVSSPKPPPGVYAGPPAYRWYGYGTPTTGANPYAPNGRYPQASESWFAQTGATPGAFPVPVGGQPVNHREKPVVIQSFPQEPPRSLGDSRPTYRTIPDTPVPESAPYRAVVAETPRSFDRREPTMPAGPGTAVPVDPNNTEMNWQPVSASSRVPIASTPAPEPTTPGKGLPVPVSPNDPPADWGPSKRSTPTDAPLPTVTISRGQAPIAATKSDAEVDTAIRSACFGRANQVGVSRPGPQRLHVTLMVPTEADARDAAAVVSRLPEVKAYSVTFEAVVGK